MSKNAHTFIIIVSFFVIPFKVELPIYLREIYGLKKKSKIKKIVELGHVMSVCTICWSVFMLTFYCNLFLIYQIKQKIEIKSEFDDSSFPILIHLYLYELNTKKTK